MACRASGSAAAKLVCRGSGQRAANVPTPKSRHISTGHLSPPSFSQPSNSFRALRVAAPILSRRGASGSTGGQFEKSLMPEDILHLRAMSMTIMQDPVCELRPEEVVQYTVDHEDEIMDLPTWHPRRLHTKITDPFRPRKLAVARYHKLILERLDNEPLLAAFGVDTGFNMQAYFMILHAWLLHQRLVLEGSNAKRLDEDLFEACWTLTRQWLLLKKTPEYRFDAELQNVQEYMLGCCIAMDKALERPDVLPARVQQVLWNNMYSGSVKKDHKGLTRLTKYLLRQLGLVLQLDQERFLSGSFVWADFPVSDAPGRKIVLPEWRAQFREQLGDFELENLGKPVVPPTLPKKDETPALPKRDSE
eukprot:TRINITY_DN17203_c0_g3_i1.p1 TRINITY_DN17203_c0_g3~~TRINITY_DN17203_c0_g3_i1.p1  ORF type:complete len:380 (+),score=66.07 TRINITY_DN17203_c0_g3_i1:57-1142(+)